MEKFSIAARSLIPSVVRRPLPSLRINFVKAPFKLEMKSEFPKAWE